MRVEPGHTSVRVDDGTVRAHACNGLTLRHHVVITNFDDVILMDKVTLNVTSRVVSSHGELAAMVVRVDCQANLFSLWYVSIGNNLPRKYSLDFLSSMDVDNDNKNDKNNSNNNENDNDIVDNGDSLRITRIK